MEKPSYVLDVSVYRVGELYQVELAHHDPSSEAQTAPIRAAAGLNPEALVPLLQSLPDVEEEGVPAVLDCQEPVNWLGYTPDGKVLATPSASGTLRMWDLDTALLQQRIRVGSTVCIPVEERIRYLGMTPAEACSGFNICEERHGRPTVPGCKAQAARP